MTTHADKTIAEIRDAINTIRKHCMEPGGVGTRHYNTSTLNVLDQQGRHKTHAYQMTYNITYNDYENNEIISVTIVSVTSDRGLEMENL